MQLPKKILVSFSMLLGIACSTTGDVWQSPEIGDVWQSSDDLLDTINGLNDDQDPIVGTRLIEETELTDDEAEAMPLHPNHIQIRFKFNSARLSKRNIKRLSYLIRKLKEAPKAILFVRARMVNKDEAYSKYLSSKRTDVIQSYLIENGVSKERIQILSIGPTLLDDRNAVVMHRQEKWENFYLNHGDGVFNN